MFRFTDYNSDDGKNSVTVISLEIGDTEIGTIRDQAGGRTFFSTGPVCLNVGCLLEILQYMETQNVREWRKWKTQGI